MVKVPIFWFVLKGLVMASCILKTIRPVLEVKLLIVSNPEMVIYLFALSMLHVLKLD